MGQRTPQHLKINVPRELKVAALPVSRSGFAVHHVQVKTGMPGRHGCKLGFECLLFPVTHAVVKMHGASGLFLKAPAQHAHQRRDAHAACDEYRRHIGIGFQQELSGRCRHTQHIPYVDPVVEVSRGHTRCQFRSIQWRQRPLDCDAITARTGPVRQRIATPDCRFAEIFIPLAARDLQRKGEELPGFVRGKGAAVGGLQIKGALRAGPVREFTTYDAKLAQPCPCPHRNRWGIQPRRMWHRRTRTIALQQNDAEDNRNLDKKERVNVSKQ